MFKERRAFPLCLAFVIILAFATISSAEELKTVTINGMTVSEKTAEAMKGGCEFNPYEKLQQLGVTSGGVQVVPTWSNSQPQAGIDPALACRLSKLVEWAKSQGCNPKIISAYRSPEKQAATCKAICGNPNGCGTGCGAPGNSCHQYGLAVDMPSNCQAKLKIVAGQFQLRAGTSGYPNPVHFQCIEHTGAQRSSCPGPCNGGIAISPDPTALANAGNYSPSSSLSNMFRRALGLEEQPPQQQQPQIPQQQLPQSQQPTQYFPQEQPQQGAGGSSSGGGTSGGSPTTTGAGSGAQQYYGEGTYVPPKSIADQLLELAYGTSSEDVQPQNTATTVPLVLNPNDTGGLIPTQPATNQQQGQPSAPIGSLQPSQTFTSSDLAFSPTAPQQEIKSQPTGIFAVLETMKHTLLRMLEILRPMGIRDALQGDTHSDEFFE